MSQSVEDVKAVRDVMFSSGHQHHQHHQRVHQHKKHANLPFETGNHMTSGAMRCDSPTLSWKDWEAIPRPHEMFHEHAKPEVEPHVNEKLESTLTVRRNTSDLETKQKLGRDIWRAPAKSRDNGFSANWRMHAETRDVHT